LKSFPVRTDDDQGTVILFNPEIEVGDIKPSVLLRSLRLKVGIYGCGDVRLI
jgi:hypothetical protein